MRAVAAICLSSGFSGWGTRSRPHICAVSASKGRTLSLYSVSSLPSQRSSRWACLASPRWRINSTPRRNSPIDTALRYSAVPFDAALRKKVTTPALAFSFLRSSLMTSVSIRYTPRLSAILHASEVVVFPDSWDGPQCFREMPLARTMQGARQDLAMLGFGTAAMGRGAALQRQHERRVNTTYDQARHVFLIIIYVISMIAHSFSGILTANSRR